MIMKNKLISLLLQYLLKTKHVNNFVPLYALPLIIPYISHVFIALTLSYLN